MASQALEKYEGWLDLEARQRQTPFSSGSPLSHAEDTRKHTQEE